MKRREVLGLGAAAGTAAAAGYWFGRHTESAAPAPAAGADMSGPSAPGDKLAAPADALEVLWGVNLPSAEGRPVALLGFKGRPLIVNFWATWCPPCVEEIPLFEAFYKSNAAKSWQIVGIAIDRADKVAQFMKQTRMSYPVLVADAAGIDLTKRLGNAAGGLPFTLVVNPQGQIAVRKSGQIKPSDLLQWESLAQTKV